VSNTHLKTHNLTPIEYKAKFPNASFKSEIINKKSGDKTRGKSYEELYGIDNAKLLRKNRSIAAKKQMKDINQINIRREKCGLPEHYTIDRKLNMSIAANNEDLKERRRNTVINNIENNKYQSKIYGRQSNQARSVIKEYLKLHDIDDSLCYYDGGGITGNEYYQIIYNPITNRKKSIAYDLVITKDSKHLINIIIEINGPWHYRLNEVLLDPSGSSCPLKSNIYTKKESYNIDALKINKALELSEKVYIFWLDTKELIEIKNQITLI